MALQTIKDPTINFSLHEKFLESPDQTYEELAKLFVDKPSWKRCNYTFGNPGLSYTIHFANGSVHRTATNWTPLLARIRDAITAFTHQTYTICVVQWYPWGRVGIKPHRDKEMVPGTVICGLSLGAPRDLVLTRGPVTHTIRLPHGSLYLLSPPTNDYWSHSITRDDAVKIPRISLTFRNY